MFETPASKRPVEDDRQLEAGKRKFTTASSRLSAVHKVAAIGSVRLGETYQLADDLGFGVGTELRESQRFLFERSDGPFHAQFRRMPLEFKEEEVPSTRGGDRKRLDPCQVQSVTFEDRHRIGEGAWFVRRFEYQGRFILTSSFRGLGADDGEAGDVFRIIFDIPRQNRKPVIHGGLFSADRRGVELGGR